MWISAVCSQCSAMYWKLLAASETFSYGFLSLPLLYKATPLLKPNHFREWHFYPIFSSVVYPYNVQKMYNNFIIFSLFPLWSWSRGPSGGSIRGVRQGAPSGESVQEGPSEGSVQGIHTGSVWRVCPGGQVPDRPVQCVFLQTVWFSTVILRSIPAYEVLLVYVDVYPS